LINKFIRYLKFISLPFRFMTKMILLKYFFIILLSIYKLNCFPIYYDNWPTQHRLCGLPAIRPNANRAPLADDMNIFLSGINAIPNSFPWVVSLRLRRSRFHDRFQFMSKHFCSGVLIYEQFVLTSAHCVSGLSVLDKISVVIGISRLTEEVFPTSSYLASKIYIHPEYNRKNKNSDIALIKLNKPVELNSKVNTICLPSENKVSKIYHRNVAIAGWFVLIYLKKK
jgi:hypothetical protein